MHTLVNEFKNRDAVRQLDPAKEVLFKVLGTVFGDVPLLQQIWDRLDNRIKEAVLRKCLLVMRQGFPKLFPTPKPR